MISDHKRHEKMVELLACGAPGTGICCCGVTGPCGCCGGMLGAPGCWLRTPCVYLKFPRPGPPGPCVSNSSEVVHLKRDRWIHYASDEHDLDGYRKDKVRKQRRHIGPRLKSSHDDWNEVSPVIESCTGTASKSYTVTEGFLTAKRIGSRDTPFERVTTDSTVFALLQNRPNHQARSQNLQEELERWTLRAIITEKQNLRSKSDWLPIA